MDSTDCVVIGAGAIGLAIARSLARRGYETLIVESEGIIGSGISSRNSEVIHAGIYYPQGSLKATLCVEGRHELYAYCDARGILYRRCGKLIVATTPAQVDELRALSNTAAGNGVTDLRLLDASGARALESELSCVAALESPSTGIIDSHAYMLALLGDAEEHGAVLAPRTRVTTLSPAGAAVALTFQGDSEPALEARLVVNSAGLTAHQLANSFGARTGQPPVSIYYAKGSYFSLAGRTPFRRLVYPAPEPGGLGVHLTLDMAGQARFGPDVEWVASPEYDVSPERSQRFYAAVRSYWPALPDGALVPAYAGIRPKLAPPGSPPADFLIRGGGERGRPGAYPLIDLLGMESPGLTASLAIASRVTQLADEWLQS
jgi:L-2-hydroxyglutarate oxidase LhgO